MMTIVSTRSDTGHQRLRRWRMLGLVNTPNGTAPVEIQELPEPKLAPNEALMAVHAFSLNRGELTLLRIRPAG
jgi:NADPH2:quinone reductase